jgi:hypothetical protein
MYRLGIWLLALVFVFNGAASYALIAPAESHASIVQAHHHAPPGARHEAQCKQVADDEVGAAAADYGHDHAHKCCGICIVASLLPAVEAIPVTFGYRVVTFRIGQHDLVGHPVGLDPEIPKTVV